MNESWSRKERKKRAKKCTHPHGFTMRQFCKNQKTRSGPGEKKNENLLRHLIREIIAEAAYTPSFAAESGIKITAKRTKWGDGGWEVIALQDGKEVGRVSISLPIGMGKCLGAYEVSTSYSKIDGLGPLLYDVAMELAGTRGLMPDRRNVSSDARNVWNHYKTRREPRGEVESTQLDDKPGVLTPDFLDDDCVQMSAVEDGNWQKSPLSKVYKKNGTPAIDTLEDLGIIEFQ